MRIKWRINVAGTVHGIVDGVKAGDEIDVSAADGARYCALHYADPVVEVKEERAVAPKVEERAVVVPEPEVVEPEVVVPEKPRPGPKPR